MFEQLKDLIVEQLGVDADAVTESADIKDDLGADSLDVVDLMMAIEETFEVEIPDEDLEGIKTVGDIENYIESHK